MSKIKDVRLCYNGASYNQNTKRFDNKILNDLIESAQKKYATFADEINAEGGYLEIHLSDSPVPGFAIRDQPQIHGISQPLVDRIDESIHP